MYNSSEDLGVLGESIVKGWCAASGITANPAVIDRYGWDLFLEFPNNHNEYVPRDILGAPIECKIQIKTSRKRRGSIQIKLSAIERLVKDAKPAFILFLELDESSSVQSTYLVHINNDICEKVLKRIRELDIQGNSKALNDKQISIKYDETNLIDSTGEALKKAILSHISISLEDYINQKQTFLKTIGFEGGCGVAEFKFSNQDIDIFLDAQLNLTNCEIPILDASLSHQRFGLTSPPFASFEKGFISISNTTPQECTALIYSDETHEQFSFKGSFHCAYFADTANGFHIDCGFFSLIYKLLGEKHTQKIQFNVNSLFSIEDLSRNLAFYNALKSDTAWHISLKNIQPISPPLMSILIEKNSFPVISNEIGEQLIAVSKKLRLFGQLLICLDDLINHAPTIKHVDHFFQPDSQSLTLTGTHISEYPIFTENPINAIIGCWFSLSQSIIVIVLALEMNVTVNKSSKYKLETIKQTVTSTLSSQENIEKSKIEQLLEDARVTLKKDKNLIYEFPNFPCLNFSKDLSHEQHQTI